MKPQPLPFPQLSAAHDGEAGGVRRLGRAAVQLCTVPETCALLRVSRWQVYELLNKRQLASVKIGRRRLIPLEAIQSFVDQMRAAETAS